MFEIGQKVICIDGSPVRSDCAEHMPLRLDVGAIYTVRAIHTEPGIDGYGIRVEELRNPSVIWDDGSDYEWSYNSERFRPLTENELSIWLNEREKAPA